MATNPSPVKPRPPRPRKSPAPLAEALVAPQHSPPAFREPPGPPDAPQTPPVRDPGPPDAQPSIPTSTADRITWLTGRAMKGEGNQVGATMALRRASDSERLAAQYRAQIRAIKGHTSPAPRSAVRVSHLCQALKRTEGQTEKLIVQAIQCLEAKGD